ncbi:potassium transporter-domain-containing protein [Cladorrhinum sp. PSN259]|nr:potassium transporter-domain-containing protein [Cladorrhinum sp. PSN259]
MADPPDSETVKITVDSDPQEKAHPGPEQSSGQSTRVAFSPDARGEIFSRAGPAGGIYHTRTRPRPSFERRSLRGHISREQFTNPFYFTQDVEEGDDWRHSDAKTKQVFRGTTLLCPLYVYSSNFTDPPTHDDILQVLSVIIWSITTMVTLKYVLLILQADNEGEGGTSSCYSLLTRYANITSRDPREEVTVRMERHLSVDLRSTNRSIRDKFTHILLKTMGVLAVFMVIADGVLTPAKSVLGAIQGLKVDKPDISTATVAGTSCGIPVLLFAIQPLGTTKLAAGFAPIVILLLGFNGGFGTYNLVRHDWAVLKAFRILLSFTGVEALFAYLGAFSLRAIQISWMCYTYPCLLLAYIGQAAYISVNPEAYDNPFFNLVPPSMLYPSLIVAVLAAIMVSQAMITATFQLISQIMKLSYCPQVKVVHTSRIFHGQLYVPFLNWLLMLGAILVRAVYSDTTRPGNAYGVCVMFVTFFDTLMVTLVSLIVWKLSPFPTFIPWLFFALIDGLYLTSSLNKVPDGAWFTLTVSGIIAGLFPFWSDGKLRLTEKWGGDPLSVIRGLGIYFDKTGVLTPAVFTHFVSKFVVVPEIVVFFHLHPVKVPAVSPEERYHICRFSAIPGGYRLVIKHGFMDEVISPDLAALIYQQVSKSIIKTARQRLRLAAKEGHDKQLPTELRDNEVAAELARLDRAYAAKIMYIVGKEQMRVRATSSIGRKVVLTISLWIRDNTRAKIVTLRLAMDRVVEVGFVKEICE